MVATVPAGSPQQPQRPRHSSSRQRLAREMRWAWPDDDGRALASSYAASLALALAWVLAVQFTPRPTPPIAVDPPVAVAWIDSVPHEPSVYPRTVERGGRGPARAAAAPGAAISDAFRRGAGTVVDALGTLRGVAVARGESPAALAGKIVLESGEPGVGSRRPGLDPIGTPGDTRRGAGIGTVGGGGVVARARAEISLPPVVVAPAAGTGSRNAGELGALVRARAAQVQSCYEREGRSRNPELAGTVVVSMTIAGSGAVTSAEITRRSWSGAGAAETEACIRAVARAWRFPTAEEGPSTYTVVMSLTSGR